MGPPAALVLYFILIVFFVSMIGAIPVSFIVRLILKKKLSVVWCYVISVVLMFTCLYLFVSNNWSYIYIIVIAVVFALIVLRGRK